MNKKVFIIAEAGVNHNGDVAIAKKMIDAAYEAGADAVKFQAFKAENIAVKSAPKAEYQEGIDGSQLEMLKRLELSHKELKELYDHCKDIKIIFMATPFDIESIEFLSSLSMSIFKIPSGEITNLPYLRKIGSLRKEIIISTGMADLEEIRTALGILVSSGTLKENITVLHCNTEYPTPFEDVNLLAMLTIRDALGIKVGYSDHTLGIEVPIAAAVLGAEVIEKHFTLDRTMPGPDHKASLEPREFKAMAKAVRNIEVAMGGGIKKVSDSELQNKVVVRKSIVALGKIKKGEVLSEENITAKRPGTGLNPMLWDKVIGKEAIRDFKEDEFIEF